MNSYSLGVWNLDTLTKVSAFQAHNGHIWNIIQLPGNNIATCSDDAVIYPLVIKRVLKYGIWKRDNANWRY